MLVALSLANRSFLFTPQGSEERAVFAVAITARDSANPIVRVENQQFIRVKTFKETSRADESVVYERYLTLRPGSVCAQRDGERQEHRELARPDR